MGDVESRLRRLDDEAAIGDTITKHGQWLDHGFADDFVGCFGPGALLRWPNERFVGHMELCDLFRGRESAPPANLKHGLFGLRDLVEREAP